MNIGIVKPTFTGAAYSGLYNYSTGFYAFFSSPYLNHSASPADADYYNYLPYPPLFYHYSPVSFSYDVYFSKDNIAKVGKLRKQTFVPITDQLEMLSPKIPTTQEEIKHLDEMNPLGERYNPYRVTKIVPHIKEVLPDANVVILTDGDINDGQDSNFDILILGHNEYVTQQEYDNLMNFVANGGILVCLDGNVLYCEVSYNKDAQTVTLVRGHHWVFDGQKAYWFKPQIYFEDSGERWEQETSKWLGSNYAYFADIYGHRKGFAYCLSNRLIDMFQYIPLEDQYITNYDGVNIIQDWGAKSAFPDVPLIHGDLKIACYEKAYGKGKSIVFGIYSDMVIDNQEFLKFFDGVLLGNAIASLAPVSKTSSLSHIIQKTLDGNRNTINQLLNELEVHNITQHQKFIAKLTGDDEVPPKNTKATGIFEMELSVDGTISNYVLNVTNMNNVTLAHIHEGVKSVIGPIVLNLYKSANPKGETNGILSKGKVYSDLFEGPLAGKYISDLMNLINEGGAYVNVHTKQNPQGEIRGQLSNATSMP